ncbi:monofunctional biosynthetic peptidoglycan transglycosylase [Vibrio sp. S11_S32]|uniref:monofunctional biosynthetic peptidoglycan transglycosylase n=1 Tax=Vibrio sp. S11_S32 TaxID=2720225 RepID=UPI001680BD21|nr:monofunctional biosynthetic peptidoglycan transglycosylase [Vibrio sp. S11_S32]MBD1576125.1 monofunctional biosynthetic peptidoglycan transglycosylase [Vibrio sp. S11_S32]
MRKWIKKWLLRLIIGFIGLSILITLPLRWVNPVLWSWQLQREFAPPKNHQPQPAAKWVTIDAISPYMQLAVIASEDQHFPNHHGIDFESTTKAVEDIITGERRRGASTITQQTVKNLFLWPGESLVRKGIEAWLSVLVELEWNKPRILEIYLNLAEFGPSIFGVQAASQHFFGINANQLSATQAARLAAVLPNPYLFKVNQPTPYQWQRMSWIETQMNQLGLGYLKEMK